MPGGKLLRGRYVLTGAGRTGAGVIEDGAVAVDGAVIREVGPAMELTARCPDWDVIGSERHVVLPGLVNSHHHGYGLTSFELGIPDDSLESWLMDVRAATYPIDPYWDTLRSITRLIRAGVTTVLHVGSPRGHGSNVRVSAWIRSWGIPRRSSSANSGRNHSGCS